MAYLLKCLGTQIYALSSERAGTNVPKNLAPAPLLLLCEVSADDLATSYNGAADTYYDLGYCLLDEDELPQSVPTALRGS